MLRCRPGLSFCQSELTKHAPLVETFSIAPVPLSPSFRPTEQNSASSFSGSRGNCLRSSFTLSLLCTATKSLQWPCNIVDPDWRPTGLRNASLSSVTTLGLACYETCCPASCASGSIGRALLFTTNPMLPNLLVECGTTDTKLSCRLLFVPAGNL